MPQSHWRDPRSGRHVWVIGAQRIGDWPSDPPWKCRGFGLLFAAERVVDVEPLAELAIAQGLAIACSWGPGCTLIEDGFDDVIVVQCPDETNDDVVLTTSHDDESLAEALEFFLDVATPASARVDGCDAWVVFACGATNLGRVKRALAARGATREDG